MTFHHSVFKSERLLHLFQMEETNLHFYHNLQSILPLYFWLLKNFHFTFLFGYTSFWLKTTDPVLLTHQLCFVASGLIPQCYKKLCP